MLAFICGWYSTFPATGGWKRLLYYLYALQLLLSYAHNDEHAGKAGIASRAYHMPLEVSWRCELIGDAQLGRSADQSGLGVILVQINAQITIHEFNNGDGIPRAWYSRLKGIWLS